MKTASAPAAGRAKTALVFGSGEQATSAVCTLVAQVESATAAARITTSGLIEFDPSLINHVEKRVLPVVDAIARALLPQYAPLSVKLSGVNLGAASVLDRGATVSGFSADTAILLAILSALLGVAARQDVVTSGHLSSDGGDIGAIRGLPEKLAAAAADSSVRKYVLPSLTSDASVERLLPSESERTAEAVINARRDFRVVEVADVAQLIRETLDDEAVVLGSLACGYFDRDDSGGLNETPIDAAVGYLGRNLDSRFWRAVEEHLFTPNTGRVHLLLGARAAFHILRNCYPTAFGRKLRGLIRSLPPTLRRGARLFPLLPAEQSLALCRLARPEDLEDVQELLPACSGKARPSRTCESPPVSSPSEKSDAGVARLFAEISADSLAAKFGIPLDSARAAFALDSIVAESDAEFWDIIDSFYATLLRYTGSQGASASDSTVVAQGHDLLERAFSQKGGVRFARAEARNPTRGGMRFVLDAITEQYKVELQSAYAQALVAEAFDPLDPDDRPRFLSALLERLRPHLPPGVQIQSPEQLASRYPEIIETYVRSLDRMKEILATL